MATRKNTSNKPKTTKKVAQRPVVSTLPEMQPVSSSVSPSVSVTAVKSSAKATVLSPKGPEKPSGIKRGLREGWKYFKLLFLAWFLLSLVLLAFAAGYFYMNTKHYLNTLTCANYSQGVHEIAEINKNPSSSAQQNVSYGLFSYIELRSRQRDINAILADQQQTIRYAQELTAFCKANPTYPLGQMVQSRYSEEKRLAMENMIARVIPAYPVQPDAETRSVALAFSYLISHYGKRVVPLTSSIPYQSSSASQTTTPTNRP